MIYLKSILSEPWAVSPTFADEITPRLESIFGKGRIKPSPESKDSELPPIELIDAYDESEGGEMVSQSGKVAKINIHGPVVHRAGMMEKMCGICSADTLAEWITSCGEDKDISAIVLDMDTPGGQVSASDCVIDAIKEAKKSKPVWAYVNSCSASLGYWYASQCDKIVMSGNSSQVGSIGVVVRHVNREKQYKERGEKHSIILNTSSSEKQLLNDLQSINEATEPKVVQILDDIYADFSADVKAGRNLSSTDQFEGRMYRAKQAVELGLADSIETYSELINNITMAAENGVVAKIKALLNGNEPEAAEQAETPGATGAKVTVESLTGENASLKEQAKTLSDENATLKNEVEALTSKFAELEAVSGKLIERNESLASEVITLKKRGIQPTEKSAVKSDREPGATPSTDSRMETFAAFENQLLKKANIPN